jgi:hypothetical protein
MAQKFLLKTMSCLPSVYVASRYIWPCVYLVVFRVLCVAHPTAHTSRQENRIPSKKRMSYGKYFRRSQPSGRKIVNFFYLKILFCSQNKLSHSRKRNLLRYIIKRLTAVNYTILMGHSLLILPLNRVKRNVLDH